MEKSKMHIGLVLENNHSKADRAVRAYEGLEPALNSLADAYETLGIGKFSKAVLEDLLENRTKNIQEKFLRTVEDQVINTGIKMPILIEQNKNSALDSIRPLANMVRSFIELYEARKYRSDAVVLDLLKVVNENGRLKIDKRLKAIVIEEFEIKIKTEEQSAFYQEFLEMKAVFESFVKKARKHWVGLKTVDEWDADAMLYVDNGQITLNPNVIEEIRSTEELAV